MKTVYATPKVLPKGHTPFAILGFTDTGELTHGSFNGRLENLPKEPYRLRNQDMWCKELHNYEEVEAFCHIFTKDSHPEYFI